MDKLPFTAYDFFGYLASGFVVVIAGTAAFVGYQPLRHTPSAVLSFFFVVVAYSIGQIVANLAGDLIERRIVRAHLGMPTAILLGERELPRAAKKLFPGYATPLPASVQERITARATARGVDDHGEGLFYHCHAAMKHDRDVQTRLNTFLNLYGFCRNMALALTICAVMLAFGDILHSANTGPNAAVGWWIAIATLGSIGLFYRYLKFLRQFSIELLSSYAESVPTTSTPSDPQTDA